MDRLVDIENALTTISKEITLLRNSSSGKNTLQARLRAVYGTYMNEVVTGLIPILAAAGYGTNIATKNGTVTLTATESKQQSLVKGPERWPFVLTFEWDKNDPNKFIWVFRPGPLKIEESTIASTVSPKEIVDQIVSATIKDFV